MDSYKFSAVSQEGKSQKGSVLAQSEDEVLSYLLMLRWTPIKIAKTRRLFPFYLINDFFGRLSIKDKIFLVRNLFVVFKSGMNFKDGVTILMQDTSSHALKNFLVYLNLHLEKGASIYEAFALFPNYFSPMEIEIVRVGEYSGNLAKVFEKWASDLERSKIARSEITSALIYPAIILVGAFGVVLLMATFVLPKIALLVSQFKGNVPLASKIFITVGLFIGKHVRVIISIVIFTLLSLIAFFSTRVGRRTAINIVVRTPILKKVILLFDLRTFSFFLASLLNSGVSLSTALGLLSDSLTHPALKKATVEIRQEISQGVDFGDAMLKKTIFPKSFAGIIAIASKTGNLVEILEILDQYYDDESKTMARNLTSLVEPALLIFVGLIVALVALSVIVPIYQQVANQLGGSSSGNSAGAF